MIDVNKKSWIKVEESSDFPIQNLPYGIFKKDGFTGAGLAIGNNIIKLSALAELGYLNELSFDRSTLSQATLNDLITTGKSITNGIRHTVADLLEENNSRLRDHAEHRQKILICQSEAEMLMPVEVGDYTDFYSSIEHATNVGMMFRDPENALLPNWKHIPVGYHGRASSIVVSGAEVPRPKGQQIPADSAQPVYGPCKLYDIELEMAFVVGKPNKLGSQISTANAEDHIFGMCLFNDLSARDIQKWEYVPLGPFLGKNFGSVVSPWIVVMEALDHFRVQGPVQDPTVLPYLQFDGKKNYDINLTVELSAEGFKNHVISRSNFKYMYWNMCQQLAHHTVNGCNMKVGDMCASGTISGKDPSSYGSMLELSWKGTKPLQMPDGTERKFLQDGDTVTLKGYGEKDGLRIGFGECVTHVLPAMD